MIWNLERVQQEIQTFAKHTREVLGEEINLAVDKLENCPVEISTRMTRTKGQFEFDYIKRNGKVVNIRPTKIKIAKHLLDNYHDEDIVDTIRHECVHLIVDVYKKNSMGHNKTFKQFCQMLGVSDETYFTATPKTKLVEKPKKLAIRYIGKCTECGREFKRKVMKKDTIHTWLYYSTCTCGGKLHVQDIKNKLVYIQNKYENLDNVVSMEQYKNGEYDTSSSKTVEDYVEDAKKLRAYDFTGVCSISEFKTEFDCLWWELCIVYDTCDNLDITGKEIRKLKTWLELTQPFTDEFKDVTL